MSHSENRPKQIIQRKTVTLILKRDRTFDIQVFLNVTFGAVSRDADISLVPQVWFANISKPLLIKLHPDLPAWLHD